MPIYLPKCLTFCILSSLTYLLTFLYFLSTYNWLICSVNKFRFWSSSFASAIIIDFKPTFNMCKQLHASHIMASDVYMHTTKTHTVRLRPTWLHTGMLMHREIRKYANSSAQNPTDNTMQHKIRFTKPAHMMQHTRSHRHSRAHAARRELHGRRYEANSTTCNA